MNNTRIIANVLGLVSMLTIALSAFASGTEEGAITEVGE